MESWKIRPPNTKTEFMKRDEILVRLLGLSGENQSIDLEYPLVLDHKQSSNSFGFYDSSNCLKAHLNYLPKSILNAEGQRIGTLALVGNVVTDEKYQGQGIMGGMLKAMQTRVQLEGSQGILLWSDIERFYQNLGFKEVGEELRFNFSTIQTKKFLLSSMSSEDIDFYQRLTVGLTVNQDITLSLLAKLLDFRYPVSQTIHRSIDQYRTLVGIPHTSIAFNQQGESIEYAFMNRGNDMGRVVHEWGARSPIRLLIMGLKLAEFCGFGDFLVLAPGCLSKLFKDFLERSALSWSAHQLGLWWPNPQIISQNSRFNIEDFFVWGLDSI